MVGDGVGDERAQAVGGHLLGHCHNGEDRMVTYLFFLQLHHDQRETFAVYERGCLVHVCLSSGLFEIIVVVTY